MCFQLFLILLLISNCWMEIVEKSSSENNKNKPKRNAFTDGFFSNIGSEIVEEYQPFGHSNINIYSHPNIERFVQYNTPAEESSDDSSSNYNIHTVLTTESNSEFIMPVSTSKHDINQNDYIVSQKYFEPIEISSANQMRKETDIPTTFYYGMLDQQTLQNNQTKELFIPNKISPNKTFINWKNDDSYINQQQNSYVPPTSKLDINQNDYIVSQKYFEPIEISGANQMRKETDIPTTSYGGNLYQETLQNNQSRKLFIPNKISPNKTFINWKNDDSYIIQQQNSYVPSKNFSNGVNNLNLKGEHNMQNNRFVSETNNYPGIQHTNQNFRNTYDYYPYFSQSTQPTYFTTYEPYQQQQLQQNVDHFRKLIEYSSPHVNYQQSNNNIYNTYRPPTTMTPTTSRTIVLNGGYYTSEKNDKNHSEHYPGLGGFGKRISTLIRQFFFGGSRTKVNDIKTIQKNDTVINNDSLFGSLTNSIENNQTNYRSFSRFGHG